MLIFQRFRAFLLYGTPRRNRTTNDGLGNHCYIRLTMEAYSFLIYNITTVIYVQEVKKILYRLLTFWFTSCKLDLIMAVYML